MKNVIFRALGVVSLVLASAIGGAAPVSAGQVASGWWDGNWSCNIDGRPARMRWKVVNDTQTVCGPDYCTSSYGAAWRGRFSDHGAAWVPLTDPQRSSSGGLYFRHADGNRWFLKKPVNSKTSGWTTWMGNRYPLSCWR